MSCKDCDERQDRGDVAYIRVRAANVGISGCDVHAGFVIRAVNASQKFLDTMDTERVIVRVKGDV